MVYKITLEYDGTAFFGWQRQKECISVQEVLEEALKIALRQEITLTAAGRTDKDVHAKKQIASFEYEKEIDCFRLMGALNALVHPHPISIHSIEKMPNDFNARFSAKSRSYEYVILNKPYPPALSRFKVAWIKGPPLNIEKMQEGANFLIGKHDFSSFRAADCQAKSPIKTLSSILFRKQGPYIVALVKAPSFLQHQVRNIMGTLIQVGQEKLTPSDILTILNAKDRTKAGPTAPPEGLYLIDVEY